MADVRRLRAVLAHIESNLELWDQDRWSVSTPCGTAYCFAGWTLALEGIPTRPRMVGSGFVLAEDVPEQVRAGLVRHSVGEDGSYKVTVSDVARRLLDIDDYEAESLFGGTNTLNTLRYRVASLCQYQLGLDARAGAGVV